MTYSQLEQKILEEFDDWWGETANKPARLGVIGFLRTSLRTMAETAVEAVRVEKVLLHIDEKRGDNIGVEENWGNGYNEALADQDQKRREFFV